MQVDYCLMGSTNDPLYLDFWPVVSKVWKEVFNVTPVLGLICDEDSELLEDDYGLIKKFKKSTICDESTQSQLIRLYLSRFLNGNCLISDIDMIPVSKKYFIDDLVEYEENDILVMSSHHPQTIHTNQYPMCYVLGKSNNLNKLFKTELSWDDFLISTNPNSWFSDQLFIYKSVQEFGTENIKFPYRSFENDRIDRANWIYDKNLVTSGTYIDSHLLRPLKYYRGQIEVLINLLYRQN